jgi:rhamnogalacturonyl hydrolase YesR
MKILPIVVFSFAIIYVLLVTLILSQGIFGCNGGKTNDQVVFWSESNSPELIGRLVIQDLLHRSEFMMYRTDLWIGIHYAEACAGFGAVRLAGLLEDSDLINQLDERYAKVDEDSLVRDANHVDANVYGILPLEFYLQTKDEYFLKQGLHLANSQWENPLPDGLTHQSRYWIDDIWMINSLQVQAYRVTQNKMYLNRAAMETDAYLKKLQQPNGLFHHGEGAPFFWGRGNGWVAAGLAELLTELPETNAYYHSIVNGYKKMMDALLKYQSDDGMWRQLIDKKDAWKETSSTAMFGYAMTVGVKTGILPSSKFSPAYQRTWKSLVTYINKDGKITDVCVGTGKSNDVNYYLNRPRNTGDLHGQAPVLWFAYSILASY